jgi:probable phosphoglycerate mutase
MLEIILIYPGSTDYDQQERIQGTLDIPLNAQGNAEVAGVVDQLREKGIEMVYTPPSEPALETAKAIAKGLGTKLKKLDRMQNLDHGLWQGMRIEDVRQKQPKVYRQWQEQPENVCPPGGEMLSQAEERVRNGIIRLLKRHNEGVIGLVVPEPLASLVRCFLQQGELGNLWKVTNGRGHWEVLEVEPEKVLACSGAL